MVRFENVEERDMDLLMMRAFTISLDFQNLFLNQVGWTGAKVLHVEHSLTDPELGESDVTVIVEWHGSIYGLLIENKIDAIAMPEQCGRYLKRGVKGVTAGHYDDFAVFITAPQAYLDTNAEARKYPNRVSYEDMLEVFIKSNDLFEQEMIQQAILKKESGYTLIENTAVTAFWEKLFSYVKASDYDVDMFPPKGAKGSLSTYVMFRVPLRNSYLYFKSDKGAVDLEFSGGLKDEQWLKEAVNPYKAADMHWEITGKSLSLRLRVGAMDFHEPFEGQVSETNQMLKAVERMTALARKLNDLGIVRATR